MMPCLLCYWNFPYCKKAEHLALLGENIEYLTQHEPAVLLLAWSLKSPVQIYAYSFLLSCGRVSTADRISSLFFISCVWHNTSNFPTNLTFLRFTKLVDLPPIKTVCLQCPLKKPVKKKPNYLPASNFQEKSFVLNVVGAIPKLPRRAKYVLEKYDKAVEIIF